MRRQPHSDSNRATTDSATHVLHIVFPAPSCTSPLPRPPAPGRMALGTPVDGIDAQPLFIRWTGDGRSDRTYTFNVFFFTALLHEVVDGLQARTNRLPDVLTFAGSQIDMVAHADTPLHMLPGNWCKECTVHAIVRGAVGGPVSPASSAAGSPSASPAPSRPPSPSPPRKPNLPTCDVDPARRLPG